MTASDETVDELRRLTKLLSQETARLEKAARTAVDAEADYRVAYATAILGYNDPKGTVATREAQADLDTADLFRARRLADELLRVQRQRISAIERAIEATRSIGASLRFLES